MEIECAHGWNAEYYPLKIRQSSSNIIIFMPNFFRRYRVDLYPECCPCL